MKQITDPIEQLMAMGDPARAKHSQRYFKTGPGEYAYGDRFIGVTVQPLRNLAKHHKRDSFTKIRRYIRSPYHEIRLFGLFCLVYRYDKADEDDRQKIYDFYVSQFAYINNWDMVDTTTPQIVGTHLLNRQRKVLYQWAKSSSLWVRRISIMATLTFIRKKDFTDTLELADIMLQDREDLIHKAVGWMLREIGKRDRKTMEDFLITRYQSMPRTMLRYAIEKLPERRRQDYLKGQI